MGKVQKVSDTDRALQLIDVFRAENRLTNHEVGVLRRALLLQRRPIGGWRLVQGVSRIIPMCPFCGYCKLNNDASYNFCPICGADMRGEEE